GDAQAVVDRRIAASGVETRSSAYRGGRHTGHGFHGLGAVALLTDECTPLREGFRLATLGDEGLVDQALGDDHVAQTVEQRDVAARTQLQVVLGTDVRAAYQ